MSTYFDGAPTTPDVEQLLALCDVIADEVATQRSEITDMMTRSAAQMKSLDSLTRKVNEVRAKVEAGIDPAQVALAKLSQELRPRNFNTSEYVGNMNLKRGAA